MGINAPRGTRDLYPEDLEIWNKVESTTQEVFNLYGFREIRTPIFEPTTLFSRGIGSDTDIVEKEMYSFSDKKGRSLTLRPEGTASIARSYIENSIHQIEKVSKYWYSGPMFRYDRPQAGRYRQFYQSGVELIGSQHPLSDAEIILMAYQIFDRLGIKNIKVKLNSVGCKVCRPVIKENLKLFIGNNLNHLCTDCQRRFENNPLRVLDCKQKKCNEYFVGLPIITDVLCNECKDHFHSVTNYLNMMRVNYVVEPRLVRGLDYYTKSVFEIVSDQLGAQNALCGGGRYDKLIKSLGGPDIPAVGFAFGLDRVVMLLNELQENTNEIKRFLLMIPMGENATNRVAILAKKLRSKNLPVEVSLLDKGLKSSLKYADKNHYSFVYIVGEEELQKKRGLLKDMQRGNQTQITYDKLIAAIETKYQKFQKSIK